MAHVSLYRKYRSQTFAEVVGQNHVTETLAQAITEDRLHHAYLFTGPRGTGKTSTARILAKSVNCIDGPTVTPCNTCDQCVSITDGSNVDVIEIDAASHGGVDDVRDLRERVAFAPAAARMKVYIVDECHMLSTAGWNAFLKTVEEPPDHVLFVFATTEPHKVLATILSRTQRFDFRRLAADTLTGLVNDIAEREGIAFDIGSVPLIVRAGDGSARDTLSVLEQVVAFTGPKVGVTGVTEVLGTTDEELLGEVTEAIAAGDVPALCTLVQRLADSGHDLRQFARDATEHLRAVFLVQTAPDADLVAGTPERIARLQAQAGRLGRIELLRAVDLLAECQAQMRRGNTRLPLELALVKAALPESSGDPAALAARMDRLERRSGVEPAPHAQRPATTDQTAGRSPAADAAAGPPAPTAGRSEAPEPPPPVPATTAGRSEAPAPPPPVPAPDVAPPAPADDGGPPPAPADRAGSHAPEGEAGPPPDSAGDGAPPPVPAPDVAAAPPERVRPTPPTPAPRPAGDVARSQPAGRSQQAPQPAGHAAPGPPSEGAGDSVDFDLIRQSWPAVLDRVKQRTIRMHALVNMSRPVHFDGATLGLEFKPGHRFHAEQCGGEEGQTVIGGALHDVLGVRPRLVCTVGDHEQDGGDPAHEAEAEAVAERELMEAAGDLPDEEQLHQQAIDTLRRNLGATVVNQPGS